MASFRRDRVRKPYSRPTKPTKVPDGFWEHDMAPGVNNVAKKQANRDAVGTAPVNTRLTVSNLHYDVTPKDLTAIFGQIGTLVREPLIKYDRSGRSSGVANVTFETPGDAKRALNQFNGVLARDQPMRISYDTSLPTGPRVRSSSAPATSLLHRIQKAPLLERMSKDDNVVAAPALRTGGVGPIRTRDRGVKNARGGQARPSVNKAKTAEELDNELDAFLADGEPASALAGDVPMV